MLAVSSGTTATTGAKPDEGRSAGCHGIGFSPMVPCVGAAPGARQHVTGVEILAGRY
ncbi:hypothetical protein G9274_003089 [Stenotrophomonas rhizophila]|nr:hypothetical protein G9274_003089 [Stenotrophomonas rhizophila]